MDIRRKVGLLPDAGLSANHKEQTTSRDVEVDASNTNMEGTGLQLWKEWATQTLGPLASEPTHEDLHKSKQKFRALEKKCADLAARAQRRLAVSAALRGQSASPTQGVPGESPGSPGAAGPTSQLSATFTRQALWSAREQRRAVAYDAAREAGAAERQSTSFSLPGDGVWGYTAPVSAPLKSHSMLKDVIAAQKAHNDVNTPRDTSKRYSRLSSASSLPVDGYALGGARGTPTTGQVGSVLRLGVPDPRTPSSLRMQAGTPSISGDHVRSRGKQSNAEHASVVLALQQEIDSLKAQLDEAQHTVENKAEMESQLREALDVLRARCTAQGARELEHQRRLQQHERLEPIFDRLAECFVFRTPEEAVERLEFLEDEQLGNFGELQRAQEEVASLQQQLTAALERIEVVRTQETSQQLAAVNRLQGRNNDLQGELEQLQNLNRKLETRQQQLVQLQGAVIDLWGCCQKDPAFIAANAQGTSQQGSDRIRQDNSGENEANDNQKDAQDVSKDGAGAASGDLQVILGLIKELIMAKNPAQASRHYQAMQQVAHRVWAQHFTHKRSLRGKVVETFEALSNLAEIMAAKIRSVNDQLARSRETQAELEQDLQRVQIQKRSLQVSLERRDQLVRDMVGVPRSKRPDSAAAYQQVLMQDNVSWGPQARRSAVRRSTTLTSTSSRHTASRSHTRPQSARGPSPVVINADSPAPVLPSSRGTLAGMQQAAAVAGKRAAYRPGSAPISRSPSIPAGQPVGYAEPTGTQQPPVLTPYAHHLQQHGPQYHHVADAPDGMHWNTFAATPGSRPQSAHKTGALFGRASSTSGAHRQLAKGDTFIATGQRSHVQGWNAPCADPAEPGSTEGCTIQAQGDAAGGAPATRASRAAHWKPPNRSEIESCFLSRLERAATLGQPSPAPVC